MEACHPCDTCSQSMFPVDTGALASAWEEATKCPWLSQGWAFTSRRVMRGDRDLLIVRRWALVYSQKTTALPISTL